MHYSLYPPLTHCEECTGQPQAQMIIEDEREEPDDCNYHQEPNGIRVLKPKDYEHRDPLLLNDFLKIPEEIEDRSSHERLRDDLVDHQWARYSAR